PVRGRDRWPLMATELVVGVGASSGADAAALRRLVDHVLAAAGLYVNNVALVATIDVKQHEPAIVAPARGLNVELRAFPPPALATQTVPPPSPVVARAVGTPSVAEAAALLAAGPNGELLVAKRRSAEATVAIARRQDWG